MVTSPLIRWLNSRVRKNPLLGRYAIWCLPDARVHIRMRRIGRIQVNIRRNRSYWLRDLVPEELMFGALQRLIRPGDVVYDAGANIGVYTRFVLSVFGAASVVAFEPMPENIGILRHNVKIAGLTDKVRLLQVALSDSDAQEEFQLDNMSSASATLSRVFPGEACQGRKQYGLSPLTTVVQTRTLDSILETEGCPPPNMIKIDVEGAEGFMLAGARATLAKYKPRLAIELHGVAAAQSVVPQLTSLGYHCYGFLTRNYVTTYCEVGDKEAAELQGIYDLERVFASFDPADLAEPIGLFQWD